MNTTIKYNKFYFTSFPVNIVLSKVAIETLEGSVKCVKS